MTTDLEFVRKHFDAAFATAEKYYGVTLKRPSLVLKDQVSNAGYYQGAVCGAIKKPVDGKPGKHAIHGGKIMISTYWLKHKGRREAVQTIYHEVAHAVVAELFGNVKSHGPEWKRVMRVVFDRKPDRCVTHSLKTALDKAKRRAKRRVESVAKPRAKTGRTAKPRTLEEVKDALAKLLGRFFRPA